MDLNTTHYTIAIEVNREVPRTYIEAINALNKT